MSGRKSAKRSLRRGLRFRVMLSTPAVSATAFSVNARSLSMLAEATRSAVKRYWAA